MFYYYGGKSGIAHLYPEPEFDHIVEPFAGAAGYSLHWLEIRPAISVTLYEKSPRVCEMWDRALRGDYPREAGTVGEYVTDPLILTVSCSNAAIRAKRWRLSERIRKEYDRQVRRMDYLRGFRDRIKILNRCFTSAKVEPASWFVDPPYQSRSIEAKTSRPGGAGYAPGCSNKNIDYHSLKTWIDGLPGQIIACDYARASWAPFVKLEGTSRDEGIYHRPSTRDRAQLGLFQ